MPETIHVCGLCGRPSEGNAEGWRIAQRKGKPEGWLIIRCPTCLTSPAKAKTSAENGRKGGRPKKQ